MGILQHAVGFDPLNAITEIVTIAVLIIVLIAMYRHWDRVMLALTGDTHMHGGILDFLWYILRCGDTCTGEWTRCVTRCPFCPRRWRGVNLVHEFGKAIGFHSYSVELKNITVGDIPFNGRGDFYLTIECKHNPDQVTSLAERKEPYVVYFPENITLRMRYSPLEEKVKIKVREMNLLGSSELCYLHLNAMNVIEWRNGDERTTMKRFEMKPTDPSLELETPPWILLEFGEPTEARELDSIPGGAVTTVRTAVQGGHQDQTIKDFKDTFVLRNADGHITEEPDQEDLGSLHSTRRCLVWQMWFFNTLVLVFLLIYFPCRFYLWSCYSQFHRITMAKLNNYSFPVSLHDMRQLESHCSKAMEGTGIAEGVPCRPSDEEVLETCHSPPPAQPWPGAGHLFMEKYFDIDVQGIWCTSPVYDANHQLVDPFPSPLENATLAAFSPFRKLHQYFLKQGGVCEIRNNLVPFDHVLLLLAFLLISGTFVIRAIGNSHLRRMKQRMQAARAEEFQEAKRTLLNTRNRR
eukprot:TRINITY_DN18965_c0_g2_i1.p1 TRINITY_DN18965_c0_g2~~TRINITY_DN18965_c0_g2_i1.p1  ORF type:complete len:520 (+),score=73.44 TRINITY_DN18965_c0_g2_i1:96-1655(+)